MNYTLNYLKGIEKYNRVLLESVLEEQNLNKLFYENPMDLRELFNVASEDQLRFIFYKIKDDLPNIELSKKINDLIETTKSKKFSNSSGEIKTIIEQNFKVFFSNNNESTLVKIYNALFKPFDFATTSAPAPLQSFGKPYSPVSQSTATPDTAATSTPDDITGSTGGLTGAPVTPSAGPSTPSDLNARGEQLRQNSTYRRDARSISNATRPISPQGGPTYYARISAGRYRPAVQADMSANVPLYIKNPNPLSALAKPYVQVADEVTRARRASPSDAQSFDKEMRARGLQRLAPSGQTRKEADGSVRRKSQFGGALGSLSNLMGDVGNTIKKGN